MHRVLTGCVLANCEKGFHAVCTGYNGDLGHCSCVCHENPAHLASTCPALSRANDANARERDDAARSQLARAAWFALCLSTGDEDDD